MRESYQFVSGFGLVRGKRATLIDRVFRVLPGGSWDTAMTNNRQQTLTMTCRVTRSGIPCCCRASPSGNTRANRWQSAITMTLQWQISGYNSLLELLGDPYSSGIACPGPLVRNERPKSRSMVDNNHTIIHWVYSPVRHCRTSPWSDPRITDESISKFGSHYGRWRPSWTIRCCGDYYHRWFADVLIYFWFLLNMLQVFLMDFK